MTAKKQKSAAAPGLMLREKSPTMPAKPMPRPPSVYPNKPISKWQKFKLCLANCGTGCYMFCCPPCPPCIIHKVAFNPPVCSYDLNPIRKEDTLFHQGQLYRIAPKENITQAFIPEDIRDCIDDIDAFYCKTSRGNHIAAFYYHCTRVPFFTILYCHGNAQDIGPMLFLGEFLCCDVCAFDYSGYGRSGGKATEDNLYADVHAVYKTLIDRFEISSDELIIYGQSIGTVPAVDLATKCEIRALILHAPLMSALRVLFECDRTHCFDKFASIDKIGKIQAPTLIIHGTSDEVINCIHGQNLYASCPGAVKPLWVTGGMHNDLDCFPEYWDRLSDFIFKELANKPNFPKEFMQTTKVKKLKDKETCKQQETKTEFLMRKPSESLAPTPEPSHSGRSKKMDEIENLFRESELLNNKSLKLQLCENVPIAASQSMLEPDAKDITAKIVTQPDEPMACVSKSGRHILLCADFDILQHAVENEQQQPMLDETKIDTKVFEAKHPDVALEKTAGIPVELQTSPGQSKDNFTDTPLDLILPTAMMTTTPAGTCPTPDIRDNKMQTTKGQTTTTIINNTPKEGHLTGAAADHIGQVSDSIGESDNNNNAINVKR